MKCGYHGRRLYVSNLTIQKSVYCKYFLTELSKAFWQNVKLITISWCGQCGLMLARLTRIEHNHPRVHYSFKSYEIINWILVSGSWKMKIMSNPTAHAYRANCWKHGNSSHRLHHVSTHTHKQTSIQATIISLHASHAANTNVHECTNHHAAQKAEKNKFSLAMLFEWKKSCVR